MREGNALRMMSPTGNMVGDDAHGSWSLPLRTHSQLDSLRE
jgi:hypothetical protein